MDEMNWASITLSRSDSGRKRTVRLALGLGAAESAQEAE